MVWQMAAAEVAKEAVSSGGAWGSDNSKTTSGYTSWNQAPMWGDDGDGDNSNTSNDTIQYILIGTVAIVAGYLLIKEIF